MWFVRSVFAIVAVATTWIGFLQPVWTRLQRLCCGPEGLGYWNGARAVFGELLRGDPQVYAEAPFLLGPIFILFLVALGVATLLSVKKLFDYFDRTENGISVLATTLKIYLGVNTSRSRVVREQLFHADQSGLNAYRTTIRSSKKHGQILLGSVHAQSSLDGDVITQAVHTDARPEEPRVGNLELVELFKQDLPKSLLARLLPNQLTLFLFNASPLFKRKVCRRTMFYEYEGEHYDSFNFQQIVNDRYPVTNIRLELHVPHELAAAIGEVRQVLYRDNWASVRAAETTVDGANIVFYAERRNFYRMSLRLEWRLTQTATPSDSA